jgi:hypothetical protein
VPLATQVPNATAASGSYAATMPWFATAAGVIRVSWSSDSTESDVSHLPVTLAGPAVCPPRTLRCQ